MTCLGQLLIALANALGECLRTEYRVPALHKAKAEKVNIYTHVCY